MQSPACATATFVAVAAIGVGLAGFSGAICGDQTALHTHISESKGGSARIQAIDGSSGVLDEEHHISARPIGLPHLVTCAAFGGELEYCEAILFAVAFGQVGAFIGSRTGRGIKRTIAIAFERTASIAQTHTCTAKHVAIAIFAIIEDPIATYRRATAASRPATDIAAALQLDGAGQSPIGGSRAFGGVAASSCAICL